MKRPALPVLILLLAAPVSAGEQPQGMVVQQGAASSSYDAATRTQTIDQATGRAVYQWDSFNIGAGETTHFQMPGADGVALNRTLQNDPSRIFGTLSSNGDVILLNPHGVLFGEGSRVDVNGLLASTGRMSDEDFLNGRYRLDAIGADPDAAIVNQGAITMKEGGWAALVAPRVENAGVITAPLGRVALGSGEAAEVDLRGDGLLKIRAPLTRRPDGAAALVTNTGEIAVEGGVVELTAQAVEGLMETVINLEGRVAATSIRREGGAIVLSGGDHGIVRVAGGMEARSEGAGDRGGRVVVTGEQIDVREDAKVDVSGAGGGGEILIGGDKQGKPAEALGQIFANAENVRVEHGAQLIANALSVGDGGRVIVWSDRMTAFAADIAARGGAGGGDGGFAEVSGKERLVYRGLADLRAPMGQDGTLLLDPTDIRIIAGAPGGSTGTLTLGPSISDTTTTPSILTTGDLLAQLALGDVTISTASGLGGAGDISVEAMINYTGAADRSLTFLATGNFTSAGGGAEATGAGALSLVIDAGSSTGGGGFDTNGGDFSLDAASGSFFVPRIYAGGGDIRVNLDGGGTLSFSRSPTRSRYETSGSGVIEFRSDGDINSEASASCCNGIGHLGSGIIRLIADDDGDGTGDLNLDSGIRAAGATDLTFSGNTIIGNFNGLIATNGGDITFNGDIEANSQNSVFRVYTERDLLNPDFGSGTANAANTIDGNITINGGMQLADRGNNSLIFYAGSSGSVSVNGSITQIGLGASDYVSFHGGNISVEIVESGDIAINSAGDVTMSVQTDTLSFSTPSATARLNGSVGGLTGADAAASLGGPNFPDADTHTFGGFTAGGAFIDLNPAAPAAPAPEPAVDMGLSSARPVQAWLGAARLVAWGMICRAHQAVSPPAVRRARCPVAALPMAAARQAATPCSIAASRASRTCARRTASPR